MSTNAFNVKKLIGRDNFNTWSFAMKNYLEHEDLWELIEPATVPAGANPVPVDAKKDAKARAKIVLMVEEQLFGHIEQLKTAKEIWNKLKITFQDEASQL
jgi:hypothetical protein